jgi:hypothetical protein
MGYKLIAQITLIVAAFVIVFSFTQPSLQKIKVTQDELFQYSEAVSKASQFNARLRELISVRDSFSQDDLASLEKLMPATIDQLQIMKEIEDIFASKNIAVTSLSAQELVIPSTDVAVESDILVETPNNSKMSYQDFDVTFEGTYWDIRDLMLLIEASDSLLEVMELEFDTTPKADVGDADGEQVTQDSTGIHTFSLILRAYGLPVTTI